MTELEIDYPGGQDNSSSTGWGYQTRHWPTLSLIDKKGQIRRTHIGEGG